MLSKAASTAAREASVPRRHVVRRQSPCLIGDDAEQPGSERPTSLESVQRGVRLDERLLCGVLGALGRPEDDVGGSIGHGFVDAKQRNVGVAVAAARQLDELGLGKLPAAPLPQYTASAGRVTGR